MKTLPARMQPVFTRALPELFALMALAVAVFAQDPGSPIGATSAVSDQKPGSVLVFNFYNSNLATPEAENTRISITNTNQSLGATIHLFLIAGSSCDVASVFLCLTPNQTASFFASDIDPGIRGYIAAVATDDDGWPVSFNFLIGEEYVKLASGHRAKFNAEAIAALYTGRLRDSSPLRRRVRLKFNGIDYNQVPRVLALASIPSLGDSNSTLLIVNRIGGSLSAEADVIGLISGTLYDDLENPYSFTSSGGCQLFSQLTDKFPSTLPVFSVVIPAGRTGWMKFHATGGGGIFGVAINRNPNVASSLFAYDGGDNLHKLTLTTDSLLIPVIPPPC